MPDAPRHELSADQRELLKRRLRGEGRSAALTEPRPAQDAGSAPLSSAQRRLWFLDQLNPGDPTYNVAKAVRMAGPLDLRRLTKALTTIVERHDILRTTYRLVDGEPCQSVEAVRPIVIPVVDQAGLVGAPAEAGRQDLLRSLAERPFTLSAAPLLRATVVRIAPDDHVLLFVVHHIACDAWSTGILLRELTVLYAGEATAADRLPALPMQYRDFARDQRAWLETEQCAREVRYWRERLKGAPPYLELPMAMRRPPVLSGRGAVCWRRLPTRVAEDLAALGREENATLFMVLLAAFKLLLFRHTGEGEICVGTAVAGRDRRELDSLIGCFVNALVLRTDCLGNPTFRELLRRVRETALGAYEHQSVPFERLIEILQPERDASRSPLAQVFFVLQNAPAHALVMEDLVLQGVEIPGRTAKFDLTLAVTQQHDGLLLSAEYSADLLTASAVAEVVAQYAAVLEAVVAAPETRVVGVGLGGAAWAAGERRVEAPATGWLPEVVAARAAEQPDAVAVVSDGAQVTYAGVMARAAGVAAVLTAAGVGAEARVGVVAAPGVALLVGLVGVLGAGAAYVPLDPAWPAARLEGVLRDCGARVVVGDAAGAAAAGGRRYVDVETVEPVPRPWRWRAGWPDQAAYVLYTSGSTGTPKGVVVTHANVQQLLAAASGLGGPAGVWTLGHAATFDFSVWEMWGAWAAGARLVVVPYWTRRDPAALWRLLVEEQVTVFNQTPSAWRAWLSSAERWGRPRALAWVLFGGEALGVETVAPWWRLAGEATQLVNLYGITETTVHVTWRRLTPADAAGAARQPIGTPLPPLDLYVWDAAQQPTAEGVIGELWVGGAGVARGYWRAPGLTADRFRPHPHRVGERVYRSGDLARRLPGDEVDYLGRADQQVKVRGVRIERGEVEAALAACPGVGAAVVVVRADAQGAGELVAYVVPGARPAPTPAALRAALRQQLPDALLPAHIVCLDHLPLTPNGKLDVRALPPPDPTLRSSNQPEHVEPRTAIEKILSAAFARALNVDVVGIDDNYFEAGGDSIRSIRALAFAERAGVAFSLRDLFRFQTVRELAPHCASSLAPPERRQPTFALLSDRDRALLPRGLEDAYPLVRMQAGMIFDNERGAERLYQNVMSLRLRAALDASVLRVAIGNLMRRHAVLRTCFDLHRFSEPLQLVQDDVVPPLSIIDSRALPEADRERDLHIWIDAERRHPFDLERAPLFRVYVHRLTPDVFQLTVAEHHAILDGWSVSLLLTELLTTYATALAGLPAAPQPPPASSFRDFVELERRALASEEEHQFWRSRLQGGRETTLPRWQGTAAPSTLDAVRIVEVSLSDAESEALKALAARARVPIRSVLLAGHLRALAHLSGDNRILTNVVTHGRSEAEGGDSVLGLFLNLLPFAATISRGTWLDLVRDTFALEQEIFPHRRLPLAELQRMSGAITLETAFNFVHFFAFERLRDLANIEIVGAVGHTPTNIPFSANFSLALDSGRIRLRLEHDTRVFPIDQVDAIGASYRNILRLMGAAPERRHDDVPLLPACQAAQVDAFGVGRTTTLPEDQRVHSWFEAAAAAAPDRVAAVCADRHLTYGVFDARADTVSRALVDAGVAAESPVAVELERSVESIIAMVAVLKADGVCVPIDPEWPAARKRFVRDNARADITIAREPGGPRVIVSGPAGVVDIERAGESREPTARRAREPVPSDRLAWIIYTSGSTGAAKGVMLTHRSLFNRIHCALDVEDWRADDRVLQIFPHTFDYSLWEVLSATAARATVVFAEPGSHRDPRYLCDLIARESVTVAGFVPSILTQLIDEPGATACTSLRVVYSGGEALSADVSVRVARRWRATLRNTYGPTEASIDVAGCEVNASPGEPVPIGRAFDNCRLYVVDGNWHRVGIGTPGELLIGGLPLARGYVCRPDLTAERFIPDPFSTTPGQRVFRTGDAVRFRAEGTLEFVGRLDRQLKVRGHRVEPAEIEACLDRHPGVRRSAVVVQRDAAGGHRLVAAVVGASSDVTASALRAHLRGSLPEYMLPHAFAFVEALPLTANGKLDRQALEQVVPARFDPGREYRAPRTPIEEQLAQVWSEVLGVDRVGIDEEFLDLGGHSLLAIRMIARIRYAFDVDVPLSWLFDHPTIERLARALEAAPRGASVARPLVVRAEWPLTHTQRRLWFLQRLDPASPAYNVPATLRLRGPIDAERMATALGHVMHRHHILRTAYVERGGEPVALAMPVSFEPASVLTFVDLRGLSMDAAEEEARRAACAAYGQPFALGEGRCLRALLLQTGPTDAVMAIIVHHIACDGGSIDLLIREVLSAYSAPAGALRDPPARQYADYAQWEQTALDAQTVSQQIEFWAHRLADAPVMKLPRDGARRRRGGLDGAVISFRLDTETARAVRASARAASVSPFVVLLGAFNALLSLYSGETDIVVAVPISRHGAAEFESVIGCFLNTVAIRTELEGNPTCRGLLHRVSHEVLQALENADAPFERVVERLAPARRGAAAPLAQVLFVHRTSDGGALLETGDLRVSGFPLPATAAKADLAVSMLDASGTMTGVFEYRTSTFDAATIERMAAHYQLLIDGIARRPDARIDDVTYDAISRTTDLDWNRTVRTLDGERSIQDAITAQAARTPDRIAVVCGADHLSFTVLERCGGQLADDLRRHGIGPDSLVAVSLPRSVELVLSVLATLKAGGAYLALDPDLPPERFRRLLDDAGALLLLTSSACAIAMSTEVVRIDVDARRLVDTDTRAWRNTPVDGDNLAYAIYTSGSTGQPKAPLNTHEAIRNRLLWMQAEYRLTSDDAVLFKTPFTFDVSVWELFWPLMTGARLVVAPPLAHRDPAELASLVRTHQITTMHFVPSVLAAFLAEPVAPACRSLTRVIASGEALHPSLVGRFVASLDAELHNLYGPTEAAVDVTSWRCDRSDALGDAVPIGRPIANTTLHVLDRAMRPLPPGFCGEIYIGGIGLARGYHGEPALTAVKFVPDPFAATPGGRLYATGDVGRRRRDGTIEFVGRVDDQVKILGVRIEPAEIEGVLLLHPDVVSAVIAAKPNGAGDMRLVAYIVPRPGMVPAVDELESRCAAALPGALVPTTWVFLEALPRLLNGKVNRRALPLPEGAAAGAYAAPGTTVEEIITGVWANLLDVARVGVDDDFFRLGGHSLLAARAVARLKALLGIEIPLARMFEHPTAAQLAAALGREHRPAAPPIVAERRAGTVRLAPAQLAVWVIDRAVAGLPLHNIFQGLRLRGALDVPALERSFATVLGRHDVLRAVIYEEEGVPVFESRAPTPFVLPVIDLNGLPSPLPSVIDRLLLSEFALRPFALDAGCLMRALLLRVADDEHVLAIATHHIVSDGWSIGVLSRELQALYTAFTNGRPSSLPPLPVQYADYSRWQWRQLDEHGFAPSVAFWRKQLEGSAVGAAAARDSLEFTASRLRFAWPAELGRGLRRLAQDSGTTLFGVLMAAFALLRRADTGRPDLRLATLVATRHRTELEPLIGLLVNTVIVRVDTTTNPMVRDLLDRVRTTVLEAWEHHDLPFRYVAEMAESELHIPRAALLDGMLLLQNAPALPVSLPGLTLSPLVDDSALFELGMTVSACDVTCVLAETPDGLKGSLLWREHAFDRAGACALVDRFRCVLEALVVDAAVSAEEVIAASRRHSMHPVPLEGQAASSVTEP